MASPRGRTGINPLGYLGVGAPTPPNLMIEERAPTANDYKNINIGDLWLYADESELYILSSKPQKTATWLQIYPAGGGGGAQTFETDDGDANVSNGDIQILGGPNINTDGSGNTVTVNLDTSITISGNITTTGGTVSAVDVTASNDITATGTVQGAIVNSTGAINATGDINTDSDIDVAGSATIGTTLDVSGNVAVALGDIVLTAGDVELQAGNLAINLGTLGIGALNAGVMQTNSSGLVSSSNGSNGQVLIGGGSAPAWANLTSTGGTVSITEGANSINLEASGTGSAAVGFYAYLQDESWIIPPTGTIKQPIELGIGSDVVAVEMFDNGNNFSPGDGAGTGCSFTAPVDGIYKFSMAAYVFVSNSITASPQPASPWIKGPSAAFQGNVIASSTSSSYTARGFREVLLSLSAGQTVEFVIRGGAHPLRDLTITSSARYFYNNTLSGLWPGGVETYVSGFLIAGT